MTTSASQLPSVKPTEKDFILYAEMRKKGIVPYPCHDQSDKYFEELGKTYFPEQPESHQKWLALAVYNWTSSSFARINFLNVLVYTNVEDCPIDKQSLVDYIWTTSWNPFTVRNPDFMKTFDMTACKTKEDVERQLNIQDKSAGSTSLAEKLKQYTAAETRILNEALDTIKTFSGTNSIYYRGAIPISNLTLDNFCCQFLEYSGNKNPDQPLEYSFESAVKDFLVEGAILTTKTPWGVSCDYDLAIKHNNGMVIRIEDPDGKCIKHVLPLSVNPYGKPYFDRQREEYALPSNTQFKVTKVSWEKTTAPKGCDDEYLWHLDLSIVDHPNKH